MNLNEECLLEFLKSSLAESHPVADSNEGELRADLKRILRRDRFVSFPQAILIRRPTEDRP